MSDTPETPRRAPRALTVLAGTAIVFLLLAGPASYTHLTLPTKLEV